MPWDIRNNWADIADLRISDKVTDSTFSTETDFRLELRANSLEYDLEDDLRVFVGFSRMTLQVVCHGAEIAVGERHGDYTPVNDIVTEIAEKTNIDTNLGGKASAKLDAATALTSVPVALGASIEGSRKKAEERKTARAETLKHVTARPNDKWEISSQKKNVPLSATYITTDTPLCAIVPKAKANRTAVQAHLYAHKNDMVLTAPDEKRSLFSLINTERRNKERVFAILVGKAIDAGAGENSPKSHVNLSQISSVDPNDE